MIQKEKDDEAGTDNEQHHAPSIFARRFNLKRDNKRVWFKSALVEGKGKIRVVSVRKEIIRDVRDMVAGFLEDNCMEFTTGSGERHTDTQTDRDTDRQTDRQRQTHRQTDRDTHPYKHGHTSLKKAHTHIRKKAHAHTSVKKHTHTHP